MNLINDNSIIETQYPKKRVKINLISIICILILSHVNGPLPIP